MTNKVCIALLLIGHISCNSVSEQAPSHTLRYTTGSDSALFYFYRGWEQIMDEGDWTGSEQSYRKSMALDPDFLIVKSLVGRITADSSERIALHQEINAKKNSLAGLERELLEAYNGSLAYIIERDRGKGVSSETRNSYLNKSERTLKAIAHQYPDEPYTKAEYIEFLHSLYGAKSALDSLNHLATEQQQRLGFFITYSAALLSEMGEYQAALTKMEHYLELYPNTSYSSAHAYYAQIYLDMDSLDQALVSVEHALSLEPNHIIAQRLHHKILERLELVE